MRFTFRKLKIPRAKNAVTNSERTTEGAETWCSGSAGVPYCDMNDCKPIDIYCLDYIFNDKATPLRTFICIKFGKTDGQGKRVLMEETWTICKLLNEKGRRGGTDVTKTSAQSVPMHRKEFRVIFRRWRSKKKIIILKWFDCLADNGRLNCFENSRGARARRKFSNVEERTAREVVLRCSRL